MFKKKKKKEARKNLLAIFFVAAICYFLGRNKTNKEARKAKEKVADCTATAENLSFLIHWYRNDIEEAAGGFEEMQSYEKEAINKAENIYADWIEK